MPLAKHRTRTHEKMPGSPQRRCCSVPDCGRRLYARGLCQTHYSQKRTTGKLKPIRLYRKRTTGTVKFAGLRLTPFCAGEIAKHAAEQDFSMGAAIAALLEGWAEKEERKWQRQRKKRARRE